jgi:putative CocE/NonD family hydrolase
LATWDKGINRKVQYLRDWVAHPQFDDYWASQSVRNRWQDIAVPNLVVGGWFDIFAKSVFDNVNAVRRMSRSPVARAHQHLIVGPWPHGVHGNAKTGDMDLGPTSPLASIHLDELRDHWYDYWLKDKGDGDIDKWPAFRIFVMGRNQWRDEPEWPLKRTQYTPWYFHSSGSANTSSGDGRADDVKPQQEAADTFVYDPDNPVPTAGGCNLLNCPVGPRDQTAVEKRADVLVYTSSELKNGLEVTGPVKVILYAASTAVDTDWTAKLVDVYPDGRPISLCDGIVRARCRESSDKPAFLQPGKAYRYEIDLWVTSNVFLAGHKIRVEISSSNFPRFDRNLNTNDPWATATKGVVATQTVFHDGQRASHILLPVIP